MSGWTGLREPPKWALTPMQRLRVVMYRQSHGVKETAEHFGISTQTVYRVTRQSKEEFYRRSKRRLKPCGTPAAYTRHLRNREVPCTRCTDAWAKRAREKKRELQQAEEAGT